MQNSIGDVPTEDTSGIKQDTYPEGQPRTKSPWNPSIFYLLTFLGGFGAAGIVAGINYKRLGKPELKWRTIGISLVAFVGYIAITSFYGVGLIYYLCNFIPTIILERMQRPQYNRWKEQTKISGRGGWGIPTITTIGSIAIFFLVFFVVSMAVTPWSISGVGDITPISAGESVIGNLSNNRDADAYSFNAAQGEIYLIRTDAGSSANPLEDSLLTLWYSDGVTMLIWNQDYEGSFHACIEWKAESTGTFFITVESGDMISYGDYVLTLECTSR